MREGWKEVRLEDLTDKIGSGVTPKGGASIYLKKGISLIRSQNVYNGKFSSHGLAFISESIAKKMVNVAVYERDILLNITGDSVARCCSAPRDFLPARVNQHVAIVRPKEELINSDFLMYNLISPKMQATLLAFASGAGSTRNALTKSVIGNVKIHLPPLPTQRKIAAILSAYDDLIENNLKRIKLLEEKAQLTYEEWFVRLKFPNHQNTPINSETGLPEGWEHQDLNNFIKIKHGFAFKGEYFTEEKTNHILLTPGNFRIGGGLKLDKVKYYNSIGEYPIEYNLEKHDLLLTMTDLSKQGDTLGYPLLVPSNNEDTYLHNQRLGKVLPAKGGTALPKYFLRMYFQDDRYRAFVVGSATGSTVKHTSPSKILTFRPKLPSLESELIYQFDTVVRSYFETIDNILLQNQLLKESRDILLPRLMTGMINVAQLDVQPKILTEV